MDFIIIALDRIIKGQEGVFLVCMKWGSNIEDKILLNYSSVQKIHCVASK